MLQKAIMAISLVLSVGEFSCNLFKTRTPLEPSQASSNWIQPTDPEKVLENMVNAFHDKNEVNYTRSFSDASYTFEATANAQTTFSGIFPGWNKKSEQDYFNNLMTNIQQNSSVMLRFDSTTVSGDLSLMDAYYHLTVPLTSPNIVKNFQGHAYFTCTRNQSGWWSISEWLDVGSDSTWSDLKGFYSP